MRACWPAWPADTPNVRRTRYLLGCLCRTARMQALDHFRSLNNFRGTSEQGLQLSPAPFPLYQNPWLRDGAQAIADDCTDMKATAGARKVNMADENSLNVKSAPPSYFIVATFWLAGRTRHFCTHFCVVGVVDRSS